MKKLYIANDLIEARLLDSILKSHRLSSVVRNESLQGGIGELPYVEIWPEIWIKNLNDWDAAKELLSGFTKINPEEDWKCLNCRETNPGSFQTCWSCNASIDFQLSD